MLPPSPTNIRLRRTPSLSRSVWEDMSGCQDIYSNTSWLLVKILIVVSINRSWNEWNLQCRRNISLILADSLTLFFRNMSNRRMEREEYLLEIYALLQTCWAEKSAVFEQQTPCRSLTRRSAQNSQRLFHADAESFPLWQTNCCFNGAHG